MRDVSEDDDWEGVIQLFPFCCFLRRVQIIKNK